MRTVVQAIKKIAGAIVPNFTFIPPLPISETQEEARAEDVTFKDTTPLEQDIRLGVTLTQREIDSSVLLEHMSKMCHHLSQQNRSMAMSETFHLENGMCIDFKVYKPYYLRKDKHGCFRKVYENPHPDIIPGP